jgi:hypothetical protein
MKLPDIARLEALRKEGDAETDPLMDQIVLDHGIHALADLLDFLFRWSPDTPFPSPCPGVPAQVVAIVKPFLANADLPDAAVPGGIDWARIQRAQAFYKPYNLSGLMVLGCASLPACYANPGVALVLMGSGRLSVQVRQRLTQTITFLTTVMTPGNLGPGKNAPGALWIRKVRLMHAIMRRLTLANATPFGTLTEEKPSNVLLKLDWNKSSAPGAIPIDQLQLGFVLLTFSWLLVRGFGTLGVNMTETQRDDHIYTWAVVGYGLGIDADLRPLNAADARGLFERIRARFEAGTEEGRLLTAALVVYIVFRQHEAISEFLPRKRPPLLRWLIRRTKPFAEACLESLARTLVRDLAGTQTANRLWVARAPLVHWVLGEIARGLMTLAEMRGKKDWLPRSLGGEAREKGFPRLLGRQLAKMR